MYDQDSVNQPFARQWDGHDHAHFIRWAHNRFKAAYISCWRNRWESSETHLKRQAEARYAVLHKLYRVGKLHRVLDTDYPTFDRKMGDCFYRSGGPGTYDYRYGWRKWGYDDHYPRHGAHFRCKVPLRITEKKVLSEEESQHREWRRKKGIDRDKANHGYRYGDRRKSWAKILSNRSFRRHERHLLVNENYADLFKTKRKDYFDPWDWD
jgi:hypothetical protein